MSGARARAQTPDPGAELIEVYAWVDPVSGDDSTGQINDPAQPYKRLQVAIDSCFAQLVQLEVLPGTQHQAIVYAQPGVYGTTAATASAGANGPNSSGDVLPIRMRDRVHVKGVRARDCILRGLGDPLGGNGTTSFMPNRPDTGGRWAENNQLESAEVLLDLTFTHFGFAGPGTFQQSPPWYDPSHSELDTLEVFEGFTFQSGDIQVFAATGSLWNSPPRAVVANCLFDMRNGYQVQPAPGQQFVTVEGPTFGVMLNKQVVVGTASQSGYIDEQILLLGNTFAFGRFEGGQWVERCLNDAVGVADVSDSSCLFQTLGAIDCDRIVRGVGNAALVNNLFRTFPFDYGTGPKPMAMLGVDWYDTEVVFHAITGTITIPTNAFAPPRVGSSNGGPAALNGFSTGRPIGMFSRVVRSGITSPASPPNAEAWDCGGSHLNLGVGGGVCLVTNPVCSSGHPCAVENSPVPMIPIYDGAGTPGIDPGFVGEFIGAIGGPTAQGIVDWRLLPDSPVVDAGFVPNEDMLIEMASGVIFDFSKVHAEMNPFLYDGEGYGNPRVVENSVDIGFDETHLYTMAGSYSNNSTSHNQPGTLQPDLTAGSTQRWVILPRSTSAMNIAEGMHVVIHSKMKAAPASGTTPVAWHQPPATLFRPIVDASLPLHYRTRYIAFNDTAPAGITLPTPWVRTLVQADLEDFRPSFVPQAQQPILQLIRFSFNDDECATAPCAHWYFNSAGTVRADLNGADLLWSNLQAEYR